MPRKIEAQITATTKDFKKGIADAKQATTELHKALDQFGSVGKGAADILGGLGFKSLAAATAVGTVSAVVLATGKVVENAISQWSEFVSKIDDYQDVTGQAAEASTRQVVAFGELGVSAETASAGMFKLSQEIAAGNKALAAYGIQVATNSEGVTDLNATLLNIMTAYQATDDAATKNAIVMAAFGKAGAAMIPILEANTAELKRLEASVGKVVTDKDIAQVREYRIEQRELQASADELGLTLGQALLPAQKAVLGEANESIYVQKRLSQAYEDGTLKAGAAGHMLGKVEENLRKEYEAAKAAQTEIDRLARVHKDAADMALREAAAEQTLYDAIHQNTDAHFAYRQSILDLQKAQKDAKDLKYKDAEANLRLEEAYHKAAEAAVKQAMAEAAVHDKSLDAQQQIDIEIATLRQLEKGLAPGSPLRKNLDAYIVTLQHQVDLQRAAAATANTTGSARTGAHPGGGGVKMAGGGVVKATPGGTQITAGEGKYDEAIVPLDGSNSVGGGGNHFHFHDAVYADGPGLDRLARALIQRARSSPGT